MVPSCFSNDNDQVVCDMRNITQGDFRHENFPANLDAERCILGACVADGDILNAVLAEGLSPDDFSVSDHQQIWEAVLQMCDAALPVTTISLVDYSPKIAMPALADLTYGVVISEAQVLHYTRIVKRHAYRRRIAHACEWLCEEACCAVADPDALLREFHRRISEELPGECHE
jgi:replicative DNA helicase